MAYHLSVVEIIHEINQQDTPPFLKHHTPEMSIIHALMHGACFDGDEQCRLRHFWDILRNNIDELPTLYAHYRQRGRIDGQRVGICGASMGGVTALGALARYD